MSEPELSIVIPLLNEEQVLPLLRDPPAQNEDSRHNSDRFRTAEWTIAVVTARHEEQ